MNYHLPFCTCTVLIYKEHDLESGEKKKEKKSGSKIDVDLTPEEGFQIIYPAVVNYGTQQVS